MFSIEPVDLQHFRTGDCVDKTGRRMNAVRLPQFLWGGWAALFDEVTGRMRIGSVLSLRGFRAFVFLLSLGTTVMGYGQTTATPHIFVARPVNATSGTRVITPRAITAAPVEPAIITMSDHELQNTIFPKGTPADAINSSEVLSIIYTGYRHSMVEHCSCHAHQLGGIDKEARIIHALEEKGLPMIKVDGGGYYTNAPTPMQTTRTQLALQAMSELGYDAINVGYLDLAGGLKVLKEVETTKPLHLISANVVDPQTSQPIFAPYVIKDVKLRTGEDVKIGVLGVTATAGSQTIPPSNEYRINGIQETIEHYLPELAPKCDWVMVLDYQQRDPAYSLVDDLTTPSQIAMFFAADFLIGQSYDYYRGGHNVKLVNGIPVLGSGFEGRHVGHMLVKLEDKRPSSHYWNELIEVVQSIPSVPEFTHFITESENAARSHVAPANIFQNANGAPNATRTFPPRTPFANRAGLTSSTIPFKGRPAAGAAIPKS